MEKFMTLLPFFLPMIAVMAFILYKGNYFKSGFVEVEATVIRVNAKKSRRNRGPGYVYVYQPVFTYEWNGWQRTLESEMWSSMANFEVGQKVILLINPKNPGEFRYKTNDPILPLLLAGFLVILCAMVNGMK